MINQRPRAPTIVARRLGPGEKIAGDDGLALYTVGDAPISTDARADARQRTRLRSAKILDVAGRFLSEATIHDRSNTGIRLLLARNVGLPGRFVVHDDLTGQLFTVVTAWRRERSLGARLLAWAPPPALKPSARAALRGRYYAIPD